MFLTALAGIAWIRENLEIAGFPRERFRLTLVTADEEAVRTLEAGSSSSTIISRIVKDLISEAEAFGGWAIEAKPKAKP